MGFLESLLATFKKNPQQNNAQFQQAKSSNVPGIQSKKKPEVKVTVTSVPLNQVQQTISSQRSVSPQQQLPGQQQAVNNQQKIISQQTQSQPNQNQQQSSQQLNLQDLSKQIKPDGQKEDSSTMNRLADLESKVQKLEIELNKIAKETESNKAKLSEIDTRLIEMLSMYELISNQMNPFMGSENTKVPQVAFEEMQKNTELLRQEIETLKANTETSLQEIREKLKIISNDVDLLATSRVDVSSVIKSLLNKKNKEKEAQKMINTVKNEIKQTLNKKS